MTNNYVLIVLDTEQQKWVYTYYCTEPGCNRATLNGNKTHCERHARSKEKYVARKSIQKIQKQESSRR